MIENTVRILTRDGRMLSYYAHPDEPGDYPAVIIYMDAPGIRQELRDFAKRVAANGYFCLLPDMYYRLGEVRFRLSHRDDAMSTVVGACRYSINNELVMSDTAAMLKWLGGHSRASTQRVGCIGYCMSGAYVYSAMGTFPEQMAAGASLFGLDVITRNADSPHLLTDKIKGDLYFGFAEHDPPVPTSWYKKIPAMLNERGIANTLDVFPNTHHGFSFPERQVYDQYAAERSWGRIFGMFQTRLRG